MENQEFNNTQHAQQEVAPMKPKNWMTESILLLIIPLCLCNPFSLLAIVAIVFASRVNGLFYAGQYAEAERAAKNAKMWVLIAFVGALVWLIGYQVIFMTVTGAWAVFMDAFREGFEAARGGGGTAW